jgi:DNA polymerase-4
VRERTGLIASAGVSSNKFLAKIASDLDKPDGLSVIRPEQADDFIASLPIERFFGIGPVTARKMKEHGIQTGLDLRERAEDELVRLFGKVGRHYYRISRGQDEREVQANRPNKSIGAETTFDSDLTDPKVMLERLEPLAERVAERMAASENFGRTVTLKIKHRDFTVTTRQRTLDDQVQDAAELMALANWLLHNPAPPQLPVRLLGLSVSTFEPISGGEQLTFDL